MSDEQYKEAKAKVSELKSFYKNLISYISVNVILIIINLAASPGSLWFYWITIFWGIAILIQASKVFLIKDKFLGKDWEEKKIKDIMEKENKK